MGKSGRVKGAVILIAAVLLKLLLKYVSSYSVYVGGNAGNVCDKEHNFKEACLV